MGYSSDSFSAGEQPTTAKWNKLWTNDASFNDGSGIANLTIGATTAVKNSYKFSAYKNSASQTINTSATQVTFDVEEYDTGSNFASNAFTAPITAFYDFHSSVQVTSNGSLTAANLFIYKNGAAIRSATTLASATTNTSISIIANSISLAASDVITIYAQGVGNAFACLNDPTYTRFSGRLASAT